ncbi:sensor domain-containing diguanylate cyclase, partial [bacterium]
FHDSAECERLIREYTTLVDIGKALTSTLGRKELIKLIMDKVAGLLSPKIWSLLLVDEKTRDLVFEIAVSPTPKKLAGKKVKRGEGIAGWVADNGLSVLIEDVSSDPRFSPKFDEALSFTTRSVICVPLRYGDKIIGVIEFINSLEDRKFCPRDLELLETVSDFVAIALENSKNFAKIQEISITDELTGLYNARHILRILDREVERARRSGTNLSFIFFDMDRFKTVNDSFGHLVGSRLIGEVGQLISATIRKTDIAARYGGDEFVIILPNTSKEGAVVFAEKLRKVLNAKKFLSEEGLEIKATASFGVATYPDDADSKLTLVSIADKLMYMVKETSRDGVRAA